YYVAYGYLQQSFAAGAVGQKDQHLNQALTWLDEVDRRHPQPHAEVLALRGYVQMMHVAVDPAARGAEGTPVTMRTLQKAVAVDPENPRAHLLLGQMMWGVAQFFGQGTGDACAEIDRAQALFAATAQTDDIAPHWGRGHAAQLAARCARGE
ncbi:MAG: hypothetical protein WBA12_10910, partial [Catalinimonas sp.]